ncbi:MAG: gluconokinase [Bifidobacterium sp.]
MFYMLNNVLYVVFCDMIFSMTYQRGIGPSHLASHTSKGLSTSHAAPRQKSIRHVVIMGASGVGKTTVATLLAERLNVPFAEGDDYHTDYARSKMSRGIALTDEDRWPWLHRIRTWMDEQELEGHGSVIACSALRHCYRDVLRGTSGNVCFIELDLDPAMAENRMTQRTGHYMPVSLLKSQLATLEPLRSDESGCIIAAQWPPERIIDAVVTWLASKDK